MRIKKMFAFTLILLAMPVIADNTTASVEIVPAPTTPAITATLSEIGSGIGLLFSGLGAPLAIIIILLAVGAMIGYILNSISKRVGAKI